MKSASSLISQFNSNSEFKLLNVIGSNVTADGSSSILLDFGLPKADCNWSFVVFILYQFSIVGSKLLNDNDVWSLFVILYIESYTPLNESDLYYFTWRLRTPGLGGS